VQAQRPANQALPPKKTRPKIRTATVKLAKPGVNSHARLGACLRIGNFIVPLAALTSSLCMVREVSRPSSG
jgi:hypothetical protein